MWCDVARYAGHVIQGTWGYTVFCRNGQSDRVLVPEGYLMALPPQDAEHNGGGIVCQLKDCPRSSTLT
jgi:hypothetical protein